MLKILNVKQTPTPIWCDEGFIDDAFTTKQNYIIKELGHACSKAKIADDTFEQIVNTLENLLSMEGAKLNESIKEVQTSYISVPENIIQLLGELIQMRNHPEELTLPEGGLDLERLELFGTN